MAEPAVALDPAVARALGDVLRDAGYGSERASLVAEEPEQEGLSALARLFALGASLPRASVEAAIADVPVEALLEGGVLAARDGDRVRSPLRITPHEDLLFLHDSPNPRGRGDQVAAVGPASRTLAGLTVRSPVETALDLGTGCGIQALLATRHARRVIATDVNERALAMAALNADLNRVENLELRGGDLFAPVEADRFGLIAANPPFVVSPETSQVFRDSGLEGDAVSRLVAMEAAARLELNGYASVLCEWLLREGEDWRDAPRAWLDGRGCDALVLHYRTSDPEEYAAGWNAPLRQQDPDDYVDTVERWVAYQRSLGAAGVATGALILRRRDGSNWFRAEEMPGGPTGAAGDHLLRLFAAQDALPCSEHELLELRLALAEGQLLAQLLEYRGEEWETGDAELRLEPGIGVVAVVPPPVVHVLLSLDGERPLRAVVDQAAAELGVEPPALRAQAVTAARRLIELGFVPLPARP